VNIPLEIKKLLAEERKVRAKWQRSHTPSNKTAFSRLSNNLKSNLKALRAHSFTHCVSTVSRYGNCLQANYIFPQTYTNISYLKLRDPDSRQPGKT
jgi:hypothetical protein